MLTRRQANDHTKFFKKIPIMNIAYDVKRPSLTRRIAGVSIRQESLRCPSVTDWQRKYSLEGTRVIPRGRHASYFVLKTSIT